MSHLTFLDLMDEVEEYLCVVYGLSRLQVNAHFLDKGGNAVVYRYFVHKDRVLKFTTCKATIALKQMQLTTELSSCFPLLHNFVQITDAIWLIEEEYLPENVNGKWINFIREQMMLLERPSDNDICELLYLIDEQNVDKHIKSELNKALNTK